MDGWSEKWAQGKHCVNEKQFMNLREREAKIVLQFFREMAFKELEINSFVLKVNSFVEFPPFLLSRGCMRH